MKKILSILVGLSVLVLAACNDADHASDDKSNVSYESSVAPVIDVYPETMEEYIAEKYGDGWGRGDIVNGDLTAFTKGDVQILVGDKKTLVDKYHLSPEWFEGYFGDNGYAQLKADEINEYFVNLIPQDLAIEHIVYGALTQVALPCSLKIEQTWEENWMQHSPQVVPWVMMCVNEPLSAQQLRVIEEAMAKPGYALHLRVIQVEELSETYIQNNLPKLFAPGEHVLLDIEMYVKD